MKLNLTSLMRTRVMWVMTLFLAALMISVTSVAQANMTFQLWDGNGRMVGTAMMGENDDGTVNVHVELAGMQPIAADHRMAATDVGMCDAPDFTSAGDDLGTFPDIQFYAHGNADYKRTISGLDLKDLMDDDGSSLVIYADNGDDGGARIVCGVIYPGNGAMGHSDDMEESGEEPMEEEAGEEAMEEEAGEEAMEESTGDVIDDSLGGLFSNANGSLAGLGILVRGDDSVVGVGIVIEGMLPIAGGHRVAITESGACDTPDFASAGDEIAQLPDIQFYPDGSADYVSGVAGLDLKSLLDADGSALVIYADQSGADAARIACASLMPLGDLLDGIGVSREDIVK